MSAEIARNYSKAMRLSFNTIAQNTGDYEVLGPIGKKYSKIKFLKIDAREN